MASHALLVASWWRRRRMFHREECVTALCPCDWVHPDPNSHPTPNQASLDICFDALDLKGDGVVSLSEFRAALLAQHAQLMQGTPRPA